MRTTDLGSEQRKDRLGEDAAGGMLYVVALLSWMHSEGWDIFGQLNNAQMEGIDQAVSAILETLAGEDEPVYVLRMWSEVAKGDEVFWGDYTYKATVKSIARSGDKGKLQIKLVFPHSLAMHSHVPENGLVPVLVKEPAEEEKEDERPAANSSSPERRPAALPAVGGRSPLGSAYRRRQESLERRREENSRTSKGNSPPADVQRAHIGP